MKPWLAGHVVPKAFGPFSVAKYYDFDKNFLVELEPCSAHYEMYEPVNAIILGFDAIGLISSIVGKPSMFGAEHYVWAVLACPA